MSRWRRLELEALSEGKLMERNGSLDLDEIMGRELDETDRVWNGVEE